MLRPVTIRTTGRSGTRGNALSTYPLYMRSWRMTSSRYAAPTAVGIAQAETHLLNSRHRPPRQQSGLDRILIFGEARDNCAGLLQPAVARIVYAAAHDRIPRVQVADDGHVLALVHNHAGQNFTVAVSTEEFDVVWKTSGEQFDFFGRMDRPQIVFLSEHTLLDCHE